MSLQTTLPPQIDLGQIAQNYDLILCDVWGVVHNGVAPWPLAGTALSRFRAGGGTVVLITNSPRPNPGVARQIAEIGVAREAWDSIVTSGDVALEEIGRRGVKRLYHIGPERDHVIFDAVGLRRTTIEDAELVAITGLVDDETETPDDYAEVLAAVRARGLTMICANPDRVVERGDRLVWCAGAVADLYQERGGAVLFTGKPYSQIYDASLSTAEALRGKPVDRSRILAIGDAVRTDVAGANALGIDCIFVTGGIHAAELGDPPRPDRFMDLMADADRPPVGWTRRLAWGD